MKMGRIGPKMALVALTGVFLYGLHPAQAAPKVIKPKVGDCYLLGSNEVASITATKSAISCSKIHNTETFRVFKWNKPSTPESLNELERRAHIESVCKPADLIGDSFNSWSYKIPTARQWKMGLRIVRCDLSVSSLESETVTYQSWKGKKLKLN